MKPTLQLRISQHLALTPQLQQSIRLLQLSTLELQQEIEQALADNPLLERSDNPLDRAVRLTSDGQLLTAGVNSLSNTDSRSHSDSSGTNNDNPVGEDGDATADEGFHDSHDEWSPDELSFGRSAPEGDDEPGSRQVASGSVSLERHLLEQLAGTGVSDRDRGFVRLIIEYLDENGFLGVPLEELLEIIPAEIEADLEDLHAALRLVQSFDPPGIAARSASECLGLQIAALEDPKIPLRLRKLALEIVTRHLQILAANDNLRLKRLTGANDTEIRDVRQLIRGLNPKPACAFASEEAGFVIPDVIVKRLNKQWAATLNPEVVPKLKLNEMYSQILRKQRGGSLSQQLQEARWLIRNVQQRYDTILRVSEAIVERQRAFFTHGEVAMRPLVLREIADQCGLHESTVSRVTTQKFMLTPQGTFELKYFFGSHVGTDSGGSASSTAIRALIKQLISSEDGQKPLSDNRIAEMLGEQGFVVARRTVAKYRESLKIPPVNLRKTL